MKPADLFKRPAEALALARASENRLPPTFVVGAPRCGTTLVGLYLVQRFRFATFPNVAKENKKTPYVSTRLALARARSRAQTPGDGGASYENRYGKVEGELAPSDGWDVLQRWFTPYAEARAGEAADRRPLVRLVGLFEELYGAPFFCKNNANSMRVGALNELFPTARFVHVSRSLPEAVASLLEARRRHGVAVGEWWSAAPPQLLGQAFESELEQVVRTVEGLDDYLEAELAHLPEGRRTRVDYDAFCDEPAPLANWLRDSYAREGVTLEEAPGPHPESFEKSRLPAKEREDLLERIAPHRERAGTTAGGSA